MAQAEAASVVAENARSSKAIKRFHLKVMWE
jgi:hypothetical protein